LFSLVLCSIILVLVGCSQESFWGYSMDIQEIDGIIVYSYDSNSERVRISDLGEMDKNVREDFVSDNVALYSSLFNVQRPGYPGQHTKFIACPEEFKPSFDTVEVDRGMISYFLGYANVNLVYGACVDDLILYRTLNGWVECGENRLIEFEYFVPRGIEVESFLDRISCVGI
tara:strand:- start:5545 stop:6060 length:516 start_codon:yes stop_codon:yes gene_type:complete